MLDSANLLQLDKYVKSLVYTKYAHAINLALVSYNNSWSTSCGHKTISGKLQPNSLDTYYDLDSLTTVLCTLCLMKLQQDHTIAFNDKIVKYLPDFKYDDITILDCMNHCSLISDSLTIDFNDDKELYHAIMNIDRSSSPVYSIYNYIILGLVIEKCTKDLKSYIEDTCKNSFEMKSVKYTPEYSLRYNCCINSNGQQGICADHICNILHGVSGHSGAFCQLKDLVKLALIINNEGSLKENVVIEKDNFALFKADSEYVCGFKKLDDHRLYLSSDSGNMLYIDLKAKLTVIVLANFNHLTKDALEQIHKSIIDKASKCYVKDSKGKFNKFRR